MSLEDKKVTRQLERELYRFQSLDVTEARVQVMNGNAYLGGTIRPANGMYTLNIKEEMRIFTEIALKMPSIRSLVIDARLESSPRR